MSNAYIPVRMRVSRVVAEDPGRFLRTFDLVFEDPAERAGFTYMPGQFCEISILGKGESPFGIASSPTEEGHLRFTVNRTGSVTEEIHPSARETSWGCAVRWATGIRWTSSAGAAS